jgi:hypothetical protein
MVITPTIYATSAYIHPIIGMFIIYVPMPFYPVLIVVTSPLNPPEARVNPDVILALAAVVAVAFYATAYVFSAVATVFAFC